MARRTHRRRFLQSVSLAGVGYWMAGRQNLAAADSPNEQINIACIGVGGKGSSDTDQAGNYGNIVALCDIDDERLGSKAAKFPKAKKYNDYRKLLDEMHAQIDAVVVSTPDHTHAPAAVRAMRLGKHVYCQKPLTHSVAEARLMRDTARKYKVATQMGNQGTADAGLRRGVEIVRSGALGPVREVHVWTNRPFKYWKQAPDLVARPTETPPVPAHVHWDLFLGTAPERPYHRVYHPHDWRGWWDFGTGSLGDMACHTTNLPFMALQLGYPTRVSATSGAINSETYPAWATITYEFPARGDLPPVKLTWYEGARDGERNLPRPDLLMGETPSSSGALLVGERGAMFSPNDYGAEQKLLPVKQFEGYQPPEPTLPRTDFGRGTDDSQKGEWVQAMRGGRPALSNFEYAAVLTETMLLGNVAVRVGKPLEYDAENVRVTNCPEAAAFISPAYRKGWEI
ncbi:MAG TPA: Gfo/Idh/MocA family oxidoreductase [Pirellulales bacterium]|nr:Gfo/Idh/MocA family oxidoreductase [Pirellulales bacterium]